MATETKKSQALAARLKDVLQFALAPKTVAESLDSEGNPVQIWSDGTPAVGEDNILIRIKTIDADWSPTDALGLAQKTYNPHVAEVLEQKNATTTITTSRGTESQVVARLREAGIHVRLLAQADGTNAVVATSQIAAATLLADIKDTINPNTGEV